MDADMDATPSPSAKMLSRANRLIHVRMLFAIRFCFGTIFFSFILCETTSILTFDEIVGKTQQHFDNERQNDTENFIRVEWWEGENQIKRTCSNEF